MEFKDISLGEKPMEGLKEHEKPWNTSDSLESVGKEKIEALKKSIDEIKELVENPTGEQEVREKIALKQKQVEICELQLKEKVSCWQDVATLKRELREKEKEFAEKQGRMDMLGKILEE